MPSNATRAARANGCANSAAAFVGRTQRQPRAAMLTAKPAWRTINVTARAMPTRDRGESQDDPRQLRVRQCGADADDGHSGDRGGETYLGIVGQGGDHKANVANDDEPKGDSEEAAPSPVHREPAADQRYQQHRQRRRQQGRTGPLHADVDCHAQEKRKIDQHGPVSELQAVSSLATPAMVEVANTRGSSTGADCAIFPREQDRRSVLPTRQLRL